MTKKKQEILMQPNNLVKSKYDFTSIENKLFYKILYNAQKQHKAGSLYQTTLTVEEIQEFIKNPNDYVSTSIKEKLNMFQQSILEFDYIEEETGKIMTFGSGLITSYTLDHEEQVYTIEMHQTLYKHITDFVKMQQEGYCPINLSLLFNFKGAYTQRIYTLLRLWTRQNREVEVKFKIETLRSYLKALNLYPAYADFKRRVLLPAIKEINASGNMHIEFDKTCEIKKGRKVVEVVFKVTDFETRKYFDEMVQVEVPEDANGVPENQREAFKRFLKENTSMESSVLDLFINDYGFLAEQFMDYESPRFKILLKLMAKAMEKDKVDSFGILQYVYIKQALMSEIIAYDNEEYLNDEWEKENKNNDFKLFNPRF